MGIYDQKVKTIEGKETTLEPYRGKVLLVVNVASRCVFTKQYDGLEKLYENHRAQGFEVLGFPCNQFGEQEPGADKDIKDFCETTYQVKFPLFGKVDVNGPTAHPLFQTLKKEKKGLLGSEKIKWNFTKFLIDRSGKVVARFGPMTKPAAIEGKVSALLKG